MKARNSLVAGAAAVARISALGLALVAGSSGDAATLTGAIVCDNFYQIFTGTPPLWVEGGSLGQCPFGFVPPPTALGAPLNGPLDRPPFSFTVSDAHNYIYIAAWSDDGSAQGILVELKINGHRITTLSPLWEVYATGDDRDTLAQAPTVTDVFNQIAIADTAGGGAGTSRGWVRPTLGACNTGNPFPNYPSVAAGISWMWYDSGFVSGSGQDPFIPGFNHKEYLIFRHPIPRNAPCSADLNGDGVINSVDLALLLGSWGPC